MTLRGVDISHHQNDTGLTLPTLMAAVDFVIVKATQGTGYVDPRFAANMAAVRQAGKLRGAYHYAGPSDRLNPRPPGDPVVEADVFVNVVGHQPAEVLVLDYEPAVPPADPDGWCATFLGRVRERTGVLPLVYMSEATTRQRPWTRTRALAPRLWVARYGPNTGSKPALTLNVGSWAGYVMWQYTSNGRLPGVSGVLDINEFYGDAAAWRALGTPATTEQEDDMPLTDADVTKIFWGTKFRGEDNFAQVVHDIEDQAVAANQQIAGLTAAVSTLAQAVAGGRDDLTAEELTAAVDEGIRRGGAAVLAAQEASRAAHPDA